MSKLGQLRALREARYENQKAAPKRIVTPDSIVTAWALSDPPPPKWRKPGRPRKHPTVAAKQRAYRERRKAQCNPS